MSTIFAKGGFTLGTSSDDMIEGSDLIDRILASFGDDIVNAAGGDDVITAGEGNDTVDGGDGNDTLDGGGGNDILTGGLGADTFLFRPFNAPGQDVIADFNPLEDKLLFDLPGDFSKFGFDMSVLTFTYTGSDVIVTIDQTDVSITLQNYSGAAEAPINVTFI